MAKKTINLIYLAFILSTVILTVFCFYRWNNPFSIPNQLQGQPLDHVTIDQCQISPKHIFIKGWAYVPHKQHSNAFLFIQKTDGSLLPIEKTTDNRQDVKDPFQHEIPYNILGFAGAKKLLWSQSFTHTIFIMMKSEDGQSYLTQYICKSL